MIFHDDVRAGGCCGERGVQDGERRRRGDGGRGRVQEAAHRDPGSGDAAAGRQRDRGLHQYRPP